MLTKESKIRILENFYSLDYVLFGKNVKKLNGCCPIMAEDYLSIKGAILSVVMEMFKLIDFSPKAIQEKIDTKSLHSMAKNSAKIARENCQKLVSNEKARKDIKNSLKEILENKKKDSVDVTNLIETKIREKAFSLAVDNLLIARTISESKNYDKLNDWTGKIIEDAYKILRDNLVESAISILENYSAK